MDMMTLVNLGYTIGTCLISVLYFFWSLRSRNYLRIHIFNEDLPNNRFHYFLIFIPFLNFLFLLLYIIHREDIYVHGYFLLINFIYIYWYFITLYREFLLEGTPLVIFPLIFFISSEIIWQIASLLIGIGAQPDSLFLSFTIVGIYIFLLVLSIMISFEGTFRLQKKRGKHKTRVTMLIEYWKWKVRREA